MFEDMSFPKVHIDSPKNGTMDLSDHYPVRTTFSEEKNDITLLSYNLQFMHTLIGAEPGKSTKDDIINSAQTIAAYIHSTEADVCCVQELFDRSANQAMEIAMAEKGFRATDIMGGWPFFILNGGLRTFVKEGFADSFKTYQAVYRNKIDFFIGADAIINKGILQTRLAKDGRVIHIINTHLQANYPEREHYAEIALAQCIELREFIERQLREGIIGPEDQVLLAGDFNINKDRDPAKTEFLYRKMAMILGNRCTILNYSNEGGGVAFTRSKENTYLANKSGEKNENLDIIAVFNPREKINSHELQCCQLQQKLADFVSSYANLWTLWKLPPVQSTQLKHFNQQFEKLLSDPVRNPEWVKRAETLAAEIQPNKNMMYRFVQGVATALYTAMFILVPIVGIILLATAIMTTITLVLLRIKNALGSAFQSKPHKTKLTDILISSPSSSSIIHENLAQNKKATAGKIISPANEATETKSEEVSTPISPFSHRTQKVGKKG